MTEKTDNSARYLVDPVAFGLAMIMAPLIVAGLGFWLFFVPVVALFFGVVPWVLVGGPTFARDIWLGRANPSQFAKRGFMLNLIGGALVIGLLYLVNALAPHLVKGLSLEITAVGVFYLFAVLHGTAWSLFFCKVYYRYRNGFYAEPII